MNKPIDPQDQALFRHAVQQIPDTSPTDTANHKPQVAHVAPIEPDAWVGAETSLFYAVDGLQDRTIKKLRRGQMPPARNIDLHGQVVETAFEALGAFIATAREDSIRVIRVIHGKGDPHKAILKSHVNTFLRHHPHVRAFCSAPPNEGGAGAVTVLIQSKTHKEL